MNKRLLMSLWAFMFIGIFASCALAQNLPPDEIDWEFTALSPGTLGTYLDVQFTGIPSGFDVSDAKLYPGWCLADINGLEYKDVALYSTHPSLLPDGTPESGGPNLKTYQVDTPGFTPGTFGHLKGELIPWNSLNWLLNNRSSFVTPDNPTQAMRETQYAIHRLMYGQVFSEHLVGAEVGENLYNEALKYSDFVPGPGQVVAVVLYRKGSIPFAYVQDVAIEVPVPKIFLSCATCGMDFAKVGTPYSATLKVTGGVDPFKFYIVGGSLPPGLSLDIDTGEITGTPSSTGFYWFKTRVVDSLGNSDTAICLIIVLKPVIKLECGDCGSNTGEVGIPFTHQLYVIGGTAPYEFSISSGSLPPGLTLNPSTGKISGIPTQAGTYSYLAMVTDAKGNVNTARCSIVIKQVPLTLTCSNCGSIAKVGVYYSQKLGVSGGTAPYNFYIVDGSLPPGLSLNSSTGAITGKPTKDGTYRFKAKVIDANGKYATAYCYITVKSYCRW